MALKLKRRNQISQLCAPNVIMRMRVTGVWVVPGSGPVFPQQPLGEKERRREAADKRLATARRLYTCMYCRASPWASKSTNSFQYRFSTRRIVLKQAACSRISLGAEQLSRNRERTSGLRFRARTVFYTSTPTPRLTHLPIRCLPGTISP